jgi:hypothetical protein
MTHAASTGARRPPPRGPAPIRPFLGTLARPFRTALSPAEARDRLIAAIDSADVDGAVEDDRAWLRARTKSAPFPPALWLTFAEAPFGTRITARFENSAFEEADLWVYAGAAFLGLVMIRLWTANVLPPVLRERLTIAFPALLVLLAAVVVVHFILRQKLRRGRHQVIDLALTALSVAPE